MKMKKMVTINAKILVIEVVAILIMGLTQARADEWRGGERHDGEWRGPRASWHGDIRHFDQHDHELWRAGRWRHVRHEGRYGWWWVAGGEWFIYPRPVYPYPDPYSYVPLETIVVQPPPPQASPSPPVQQFWYFCVAANGYYPYVPTCPGGWQPVPATPSPSPPAAPSVVMPNSPPGYTPPGTPPSMSPGAAQGNMPPAPLGK
jgi:hypothetical protein